MVSAGGQAIRHDRTTEGRKKGDSCCDGESENKIHRLMEHESMLELGNLRIEFTQFFAVE